MEGELRWPPYLPGKLLYTLKKGLSSGGGLGTCIDKI